MPVVFYADSRDQHIAEEKYHRHIEALVNDQLTKGNRTEPLNAQSDQRIFSLRLTGEARLIYTHYMYKGEKHFLVLEVDETHGYDSKYLKSGVLKGFLDKQARLFDKEIDRYHNEKRAESNDNVLKLIPVTIIGENAIILDEQQKNISIPSIVEGSPGSGKTCVGYHMLEKYIKDNAGNLAGKKILYVTMSGYLVRHINRCWEESAYRPQADDPLEISTYGNLLAKFNPGLPIRTNGKATFKEWYINNISTKKSNGKSPKGTQLLPSDADLVWQAFRNYSGRSEIQEDAGQKQRAFSSEKETQVKALYAKWQEYCTANEFQFMEFIKINEVAQEQQYDMIFVDESQDLSTQSLANLLKLAKNNQIVYALDSRQNLQDSLSKTVEITKIFHDAGFNMNKVQVVELVGSYRCKHKVMNLAKGVNDLRIKMTPTQKKKEGHINIIEEGEPGEVVILDARQKGSLAQIDEMAKNADVCIITTAYEKQRIQSDSSKHWAQVFTPEEIKGLEYKTVILYNILSEEVFKNINKAIVREERDWAYATALNAVFTAMTRAEDAVYVYQENPHPVQNIMNIMKGSASDEATKAQTQAQTLTKVSTPEDWLLRAKSLVENNREVAIEILKEKLKYTDEEVTSWLSIHALEEEPEIIKSTPEARATTDGGSSSGSGSTTVQYNKNQCVLFTAIDKKDFVIMEFMAKRFKRLDWTVPTPSNINAIDVLLSADTDKSREALRVLFLEEKLDVSMLSESSRHQFFSSFVYLNDLKSLEVFVLAPSFDILFHTNNMSETFKQNAYALVSAALLQSSDQRARHAAVIEQLLDGIKKDAAKIYSLILFKLILVLHRDEINDRASIPECFQVLHRKAQKLKDVKARRSQQNIIDHIEKIISTAIDANIHDAYLHGGVFYSSKMECHLMEGGDPADIYQKADQYFAKAVELGVSEADTFLKAHRSAFARSEDREKTNQTRLRSALERSDLTTLIELIDLPEQETATLDWNITTGTNHASVLHTLIFNGSTPAIYKLLAKKQFNVSKGPLEKSPIVFALTLKRWGCVEAILNCKRFKIDDYVINEQALKDKFFNLLLNYLKAGDYNHDANLVPFFKTHSPNALIEYIVHLGRKHLGFNLRDSYASLYDLVKTGLESTDRQRETASNRILSLMVALGETPLPLGKYFAALNCARVYRESLGSQKIKKIREIISLCQAAIAGGVTEATALLASVKKEEERIAPIVDAYSRDYNQKIEEAIRNDDFKILSSLIEHAEDDPALYDFSYLDEESGRTALLMVFVSEHHDRVKFAKFLIARCKVSPTASNRFGDTAFTIAVASGDKELIDYYLTLDAPFPEVIPSDYKEKFFSNLVNYYVKQGLKLDSKIARYFLFTSPTLLLASVSRYARNQMDFKCCITDAGYLHQLFLHCDANHKLDVFDQIVMIYQAVHAQNNMQGTEGYFLVLLTQVKRFEEDEKWKAYSCLCKAVTLSNKHPDLNRFIPKGYSEVRAQIEPYLKQIPINEQFFSVMIRDEAFDDLYALLHLTRNFKPKTMPNWNARGAGTQLTLLMILCKDKTYEHEFKLEMIQSLLDLGADVNALDAQGNSAYIYAAIIAKDPMVAHALRSHKSFSSVKTQADFKGNSAKLECYSKKLKMADDFYKENKPVSEEPVPANAHQKTKRKGSKARK